MEGYLHHGILLALLSPPLFVHETLTHQVSCESFVSQLTPSRKLFFDFWRTSRTKVSCGLWSVWLLSLLQILTLSFEGCLARSPALLGHNFWLLFLSEIVFQFWKKFTQRKLRFQTSAAVVTLQLWSISCEFVMNRITVVSADHMRDYLLQRSAPAVNLQNQRPLVLQAQWFEKKNATNWTAQNIVESFISINENAHNTAASLVPTEIDSFSAGTSSNLRDSVTMSLDSIAFVM